MGRLDANDIDDALLLLRMDAPANVIVNDGFGQSRFDTNPRMLVALLAEPGGGWRRIMADHALIPRPESPVMDDYLGDDPATAITISRKHTWSVHLHSWASAGTWYMREIDYTFRLEGSFMRLVGFDSITRHRASGDTETESVNTLTGRAWTSTGSIAADTPGEKNWTRMNSKVRVCIGDIGDGLDFGISLNVGAKAGNQDASQQM